MIGGMHPRRLRLLIELSRRGTMREVAEATGSATSAVSQQLSVLEREAGAQLLEHTGRNVRLTPAGLRLVDHAEGILAALEAARYDLSEQAEPRGVVRVASYASALTDRLVPIAQQLTADHPGLDIRLEEHEPDEVEQLLADGEIDLGITYDFDIAPRSHRERTTTPLTWRRRWSLATQPGLGLSGPTTTDVIRALPDIPWIVNSRGGDDQQVVERLCALADVPIRIGHRADSLELVEALIGAGMGVALLPADRARVPGIVLHRLPDPQVWQRSYAHTPAGHAGWPPVAALLEALRAT